MLLATELVAHKELKMIKSGDEVEFIGVKPKQVMWSSTDYPSDLIIGNRYTVKEVFTHLWYTKITIFNKPGTFNSVHFKKVL